MKTTQKKAKARDLSDLYRIACDPGSTQKQLRKVWGETKSSKVRKAVASNLNCDPETMRIAARLYIKEVIENPSFKLLKFFGETDPFIEKLFDAYETPDAFARKTRLDRYRGESALLCRAMLLSPQTSSPSTLEKITSVLGVTELKRELKDGSLKARIRTLALSKMKSIASCTILDLYNCDVLTLAELEAHLDTCAPYSLSAGSSVAIKRIVERLASENPINYDFIFKLLVTSNHYTVRSSLKSIFTASGGDKFIKMMSPLYRDMLYYDVCDIRRRNSVNTFQPRWYYPQQLSSSSSSGLISGAMWKFLAEKYKVAEGDWKSLDFNAFVNDVRNAGLMSEYAPYSSKVKFKASSVAKKQELLEAVVKIASDDDFTYFVSKFLSKMEIFARAVDGTAERAFVDRINRINQARFLADRPLLTRWSKVDVHHPVVTLELLFRKQYDVSGKGSPVSPATSGVVSQKLMDSFLNKVR